MPKKHLPCAAAKMNQMSGRAACLRVLRQECGRQVHRSGGSQTAAGREVMISGNIHEKGPEHRAPAPPEKRQLLCAALELAHAIQHLLLNLFNLGASVNQFSLRHRHPRQFLIPARAN